MSFSLADLPREVLLKIASYATPEEAIRRRAVCVFFRDEAPKMLVCGSNTVANLATPRFAPGAGLVFAHLERLSVTSPKRALLARMSHRFPRLKYLTLRDCPFDTSWLSVFFPKLEELTILDAAKYYDGCQGPYSLCGGFPALRELYIDSCSETSLRGSFPELRRVRLRNCTQLVSMSSQYPKLRFISIEDSSLLVLNGDFPSLQHLTVDKTTECKLSGEFPRLESLLASFCGKVLLANTFPSLGRLSIAHARHADVSGRYDKLRTLLLHAVRSSKIENGVYPVLDALTLSNSNVNLLGVFPSLRTLSLTKFSGAIKAKLPRDCSVFTAKSGRVELGSLCHHDRRVGSLTPSTSSQAWDSRSDGYSCSCQTPTCASNDRSYE